MQEKVFSAEEVERLKAEVRRKVVEEVKMRSHVYHGTLSVQTLYEVHATTLDAIAEGGEK